MIVARVGRRAGRQSEGFRLTEVLQQVTLSLCSRHWTYADVANDGARSATFVFIALIEQLSGLATTMAKVLLRLRVHRHRIE